MQKHLGAIGIAGGLLSSLFCASGSPALAQECSDKPTSIYLYNRDTLSQVPVTAITSRTVVQGPVATTRIEYRADNSKNLQPMEAGVNLHLPEDSVLTGFGYYAGNRFIPGKMYDKNEAWKIYQAVTSRGRDPGVMDRPTQQDYHAQIFPVAPKQDLRVVVVVVQALHTDAEGAHLQVPLALDKDQPVQVDAKVRIHRHTLEDIDVRGDLASQEDLKLLRREQDSGSSVLHLLGELRPTANWDVLIRRTFTGPEASYYSGRTRSGAGYFAIRLSVPQSVSDAKLTLHSSPSTSLTLPTRFGNHGPYQSFLAVGKYDRATTLQVTLRGKGLAHPLHASIPLDPRKTTADRGNPAAALWADRRITVMQDSPKDLHRQVVGLSQRFNVVSRYTALLAIPREELEFYKKLMAERNVQTNTTTTGGGGGDPYIGVRAPADAQQVVAVFPNGDVKDLAFDSATGEWSGRFDIPFGTPEGAYRVTIIVVHKDGTRTPFVLVYQNLLGAPQMDPASSTQGLVAQRGRPLMVRIESAPGLARAVAVTPWGERAPLQAKDGVWSCQVTAPADYAPGKSSVTLILLDGAHNRTEVTLNVDIQ